MDCHAGKSPRNDKILESQADSESSLSESLAFTSKDSLTSSVSVFSFLLRGRGLNCEVAPSPLTIPHPDDAFKVGDKPCLSPLCDSVAERACLSASGSGLSAVGHCPTTIESMGAGSVASRELYSRPLRGAEALKQGGSSAAATLELEADKRGTPLDCRKEKAALILFGAKGSGEGINPFSFCDTRFKESRESKEVKSGDSKTLESTTDSESKKLASKDTSVFTKPQHDNNSDSKTMDCHAGLTPARNDDRLDFKGVDCHDFASAKSRNDKGRDSKSEYNHEATPARNDKHTQSQADSKNANTPAYNDDKTESRGRAEFTKWLYALILLLYCAGMVAFSRYTFNLDDIWMWLDIYHNKPIFNGYAPESGRFFPLASLDLDLLMRLFPSPYIFFAFNALLVAGIGVMLWQILGLLCGARHLWLRLALLGGFLLHPGFVTIMLGICYPERMQAVFLLLFVLASLRFYKGYALRYAWLGVVSANIALYYKEPTFLMIGCFGLLGVLVAYQRGLGRRALVYAGSLVVSAGVYLALYLTLILPKITRIYQRGEFESVREAWLAFARGMFNFALNDVFLLVLLPAIVLYRIALIVRKKSQIHILWDSLLLSTLLYLGAFIKLKLFENYYLLPMYFMGFGAVVYFLWIEGYVKKLFFRALSVMCAIIFVVNTLPQGVYTYAWLKGEGLKFHSALEFIAFQAQNRENLNLYFDGNGENRKLYSTYYWIYIDRYLKELYHTHNLKVHFDLERARSGDLILLNQSSNKRVDSAYLADMEQRYTLIYTSPYFTLPYIGLKPLLKLLFSSSQTLKETTYGQENYFRLPMRDYIYQVP